MKLVKLLISVLVSTVACGAVTGCSSLCGKVGARSVRPFQPGAVICSPSQLACEQSARNELHALERSRTDPPIPYPDLDDLVTQCLRDKGESPARIPLHMEPTDDSEIVVVVEIGASGLPVEVLEAKAQGWRRVSLHTGSEGWLREELLCLAISATE